MVHLGKAGEGKVSMYSLAVALVTQLKVQNYELAEPSSEDEMSLEAQKLLCEIFRVKDANGQIVQTEGVKVLLPKYAREMDGLEDCPIR